VNRLATETSPYLRQHAQNPVDWYPWGPEAFTAAAARDVPILLSVGYSSCHWCHVMAHESFEDDRIAALMNEHFVNVKVDREERPDVDAVYMDAVQSLTGRGGWPMTVFLTPDGRPFYGGTYFPPTGRGGAPGFDQVLDAISDVWRNRRAEVETQTAELLRAVAANTLTGRVAADADPPLDPSVLDAAIDAIRESFDPDHGGFGRAPKFPQAMTIDLLVRTAGRRPEVPVLDMVTTSLDAMAAGGIYDHVGGGFARYSTDGEWLVPHFEKMLYDQALLVGAYLRGFLATGRERYREVVEETVHYVLTKLRHPDGGFFSAEDADSEGVEGKFYLWSPAEIAAVCRDDAQAVIDFFGVTESGNFRDPHTGYSGSILAQVDRQAVRSDAVRRGLARLAVAREQRVRPGLDDKVVTAWNALFATVLFEAAAAFERDDWFAAARTNLRFLLDVVRVDGRLMRTWHADGGARHLAVAEDYAALANALVTAAELDDVEWLTAAGPVLDDLERLFGDAESGGFFTTGADADPLIVRPQDFFDNATPAENSLAAEALLRFAAVTGDETRSTGVRRLLGTLGPTMAAYPTSFGVALGAYLRALGSPVELALVGPDPSMRTIWARRVSARTVGVRSPAGSGSALTPLLDGRTGEDGTRVYLCEGFACRLPTTDPEEFAAQLAAVLGD
jgi:uncharacterized protein YyaL (SSP411 family)